MNSPTGQSDPTFNDDGTLRRAFEGEILTLEKLNAIIDAVNELQAINKTLMRKEYAQISGMNSLDNL